MLKNVLNSWYISEILSQFDKHTKTSKNFITTNAVKTSTYKKHEINKYTIWCN